MSFKDITIVITSFRSDQKIENCINSIDRLCKVVVVENSNNINFKNHLESKFANVDCILTGSNFGYGKANNIGLSKVKTKFALILNPDTTLQESTIWNFFKIINDIPDFAIIGPYAQESKDENIEEQLKYKLVNNVKGFAMFLNITEFNKVGFFDESFFIYFEEIDLCKRLISNNKKIYLVPSIKINHIGGQSHNIDINEKMELSRNWHWMWSTFNYQKKYNGFFIALLLVMPKLFSSILRFFFYTLIFNFKKRNIYYQRFSGLWNAILGKSSWYRPDV